MTATITIPELVARIRRCAGRQFGCENPVLLEDSNIAAHWHLEADARERPRLGWVIPDIQEPRCSGSYAAKARAQYREHGFETYLVDRIDHRDDAVWSARAICMLEPKLLIMLDGESPMRKAGYSVLFWGQDTEKFSRHFSEIGRIINMTDGYQDAAQNRPMQDELDPEQVAMAEEIEAAQRRAAIGVIFSKFGELSIQQIIERTPNAKPLHETLMRTPLVSFIDLAVASGAYESAADDDADADPDPGDDDDDDDDFYPDEEEEPAPDAVPDLDPDEEKLVRALRVYEGEGTTRGQLQKDLGLSQSKTRRLIQTVAEKGLVRDDGSAANNPRRRYFLAEFTAEDEELEGDDG